MDKKFGNIIFNNQNFLIINKNPHIVSTQISPLICHRLDKGTSGILIIAKNLAAKNKIQQQFKNQKIQKEYLALVLGRTEKKFTIEGFIFRDKKSKDKRRFIPGFKNKDYFLANKKYQRYSKTEFKTLACYNFPLFSLPNQQDLNFFCLVQAVPKTGRTHQIRLHLANCHHPILGDKLYGGKIIKKISQKLAIPRLLLHASKISFREPKSEKIINIDSKIPQDFQKIIIKISGNKNE